MCRLTKLAHANLAPTSSRKPMDVDGTTRVNSAAASVFAKGQDDPKRRRPSETIRNRRWGQDTSGSSAKAICAPQGRSRNAKNKRYFARNWICHAFFEASCACEMNCFHVKGLEGLLSSKEGFPKSGSKQKCLG